MDHLSLLPTASYHPLCYHPLACQLPSASSLMKIRSFA
jgi:hypothetical protein